MSTRPVIQFAASQPGFDLFNRTSGINTFLYPIIHALSGEYDFYINDIRFDDRNKNFVDQQDLVISGFGKSSPVKKLIPAKIKTAYRDRRGFKYENLLLEKIRKSNPKPDMVFELLKHGSRLGLSLAANHKVPYIIFFDSPAVEQFKEVHGYRPLYASRIERNEWDSLKNADKVLVYSQPVRDFLLHKLPDSPFSKFEIFSTLDYGRLQVAAAPKTAAPVTIGFLGTFMKWHRVDFLIRAFNELKPQFPQLKLIMAGAGGTLDEIKKQGAESPYAGDITFTGFVYGPQLETIKQQFDIGVMPGSNWYGIPTKVFEYGAMGTPVLAPDTRNVKSVFTDGENITLFQNGDYASFKQGLHKLVSDEMYYRQSAQNMHTFVTQHCSLDKAVIHYRDVINSLL